MTGRRSDEDSDAVPRAVRGRENTDVLFADERASPKEKIERLHEKIERLHEKTTQLEARAEALATKDELRREVTGARDSIEKSATTKYVDANVFEEYRKNVTAELARLTASIAQNATTLAVISAPKPAKDAPWLAIIGPILAIAGIVWAASRYPERSEFRELETKVTSIEKLDAKRDQTVEDVKHLAERVLDAIVGKVRVLP